jgi:hypothetical protein
VHRGKITMKYVLLDGRFGINIIIENLSKKLWSSIPNQLIFLGGKLDLYQTNKVN